ncbi:DNA-directed RNA polymerase IV subunit 1 isoform X2 [Lotus japonicus]|uniref:DNA-directed RNA polymerase IV subunit 1 isoform X2 n=1 Tax=Lotus japonicus TaxID=34305 RepID=UPI002586A53A|nr:DNA-directed RNA polymerase IV subunit 1 isoform X2 [Lotus japonicus]
MDERLPSSMDDNDKFHEHNMPSGVITAIKFDVLTGEDIRTISALEIEAAGQVVCSDLGLPNSSEVCTTCGTNDKKLCEGHFGAIKFPFSIVHPYFISEAAEILNKICPACKSIRCDLLIKGVKFLSVDKKLNDCKYCSGISMGRYPTMKFRVSYNNLSRSPEIISEINDTASKKKTLGQRLAADYWDFIPNGSEEEESLVNRRLSLSQVHHLLSDVDPDFIEKYVPRKSLLDLNYFPVTPNGHRVTEFSHRPSNGPKLSFDDRTRACKKLVDFRGPAVELSSHVINSLSLSKLNPDKTPSNMFTELQQRKVGENACNSSGLRWMKDVVLGKRNDCSFRTVVVGDPDLALSEIGVPCQIAESLQVSVYVNRENKKNLLDCCELRLLEKGHFKVCRKGRPVVLYKKKDLQIGDLLYRPLTDGDKVLINRPPSIHQHSMISLSVRVLPISSVVSINPLCCSPLRGDFDGDCLHGYIPQSVAARVELNELVALDRQLINGQSGRNLLSLSQDSLTAAYMLMEDGVLLNLYEIQQLQMLCDKKLTPPPSIIKAPSRNNSLWSGKQLFSMLLPSNFDYSFPPNGVSVSDGELTSSFESSGWLRDSECNIFQRLVERFQDKTLNLLYDAQKVLCEWLSMTGFSVSLSDLYLSSDSCARENMMEEISYGLQEAEQACDFNQLLVDHYCDFLSGSLQDSDNVASIDMDSLNYEKHISAALSEVSVDAFRHMFRNIQSLVDKYASKGNAFLTMFKAGSKGNLLKLVQHSMCLGLQHSLVRLSYRMPRELSCAAWNSEKGLNSMPMFSNTLKSIQCYIPHAVVESSFLTGLNPLECFAHSVANRDSSFSDNADLPGTLTRRLMFFMRDLYQAYDGTVRNLYGNQLIQFSYDTDKDSSCDSGFQEGTVGGEPVGALSACAISEAAYSALGQPISLLETSPLLNLKNVLECGSRKKSGDQTVSLFLSDKLGKQRYGFEYAALEVKNYLERVMFSDIVSTVMIMFTPQSSSLEIFNPWVCHFHLDKEIVARRKLTVHSVIESLYRRYESLTKESKVTFPNLKISSKKCSKEGGYASLNKEKEDVDCISVTIVESSRSSAKLEAVRDLMIPFLLGTVIKGFLEIKKVDILWSNRSKVSNSYAGSSGELYLRVTMSSDGDSGRFWGVLINHCHRIMPMIDWTRSHPDNIHHFCSAYGIDAGRQYFLHSLASATTETGKSILPKHLHLVANSLSASGEFVGLNAKGIGRQRKHASVSSPFVQACFSNPGTSFIKAAKSGVLDDLQGCLDALAWGKCMSMGTSGQFDIMHSEKVEEFPESADVYSLLIANFDQLNDKVDIPHYHNRSSNKCDSEFSRKNGGYALKEYKQSKSFIRNFVTVNDIQKLAFESRSILSRYSIDQVISDHDKITMLRVLHFHPRKNEKLGCGPADIKVGWHPVHKDSRCFHIIRSDESVEDFSYRKCILRALEIVDPGKFRIQKKKWLGQDDIVELKKSQKTNH